MISRIPEETCLPDNDNFSAHDLLKKKKKTQLKLRYQKVMRKKEKEEEEKKKKKRQMECLYKTGNINTGTSSSNLFLS